MAFGLFGWGNCATGLIYSWILGTDWVGLIGYFEVYFFFPNKDPSSSESSFNKPFFWGALVSAFGSGSCGVYLI